MIPTAEIAWRRVAWIPMGLMQSVGEVGTSSYRMLAPLHGRVQYFGFANTVALAVALHIPAAFAWCPRDIGADVKRGDWHGRDGDSRALRPGRLVGLAG